MTPRSKEFFDRAWERLEGARKNLEQGEYAITVGAAYYAMLYAARAALSEQDETAKTHRGTWALFREAFVEPGRFDRDLFSQAQRTQELREAADYEAGQVSTGQAETIVEQAAGFVSAVEDMLRA